MWFVWLMVFFAIAICCGVVALFGNKLYLHIRKSQDDYNKQISKEDTNNEE